MSDWIPVTERLPENDALGSVARTTKGGCTITCFKCGKILPGTMCPGEYVMCKECEEKWSSIKSTIDKDVLERMVNELMKLKPFGWVFIPKMKDALTISVDNKPVVLCQDCKHYNADFECLIEGYGIERDKDWFCGSAERREEDD